MKSYLREDLELGVGALSHVKNLLKFMDRFTAFAEAMTLKYTSISTHLHGLVFIGGKGTRTH